MPMALGGWLTLRSLPNGEGSTSSHPMPWGGSVQGRKSSREKNPRGIGIRWCLMSTGNAPEPHLGFLRLSTAT